MARQAEADRERRARIITADGEFQASQKLSEAARSWPAPAALQLRLLQTMVEVAAEKYSTLVLPFPVELLRFLEHSSLPHAESAAAARTANEIRKRAEVESREDAALPDGVGAKEIGAVEIPDTPEVTEVPDVADVSESPGAGEPARAGAVSDPIEDELKRAESDAAQSNTRRHTAEGQAPSGPRPVRAALGRVGRRGRAGSRARPGRSCRPPGASPGSPGRPKRSANAPQFAGEAALEQQPGDLGGERAVQVEQRVGVRLAEDQVVQLEQPGQLRRPARGGRPRAGRRARRCRRTPPPPRRPAARRSACPGCRRRPRPPARQRREQPPGERAALARRRARPLPSRRRRVSRPGCCPGSRTRSRWRRLPRSCTEHPVYVAARALSVHDAELGGARGLLVGLGQRVDRLLRTLARSQQFQSGGLVSDVGAAPGWPALRRARRPGRRRPPAPRLRRRGTWRPPRRRTAAPSALRATIEKVMTLVFQHGQQFRKMPVKALADGDPLARGPGRTW